MTRCTWLLGESLLTAGCLTTGAEAKYEPLKLSESELATILFEHPILGSLADYPNGRLLG